MKLATASNLTLGFHLLFGKEKPAQFFMPLHVGPKSAVASNDISV